MQDSTAPDFVMYKISVYHINYNYLVCCEHIVLLGYIINKHVTYFITANNPNKT